MPATVPLDGPGLILDLTETTYLSSGGVRLLFEVAERLHARDQRLVLVMTNQSMIRRVRRVDEAPTSWYP